jgi:hypothetical protein
MDEATWMSSTHFQKLYGFVKSTQGAARSKGGRRKLRLLACAICRTLLWGLPVHDSYRRVVEAAEAFADGAITWGALAAATLANLKAALARLDEPATVPTLDLRQAGLR